MQNKKKHRKSFYYTSGVALTVIIFAIIVYAVIYTTLYLNGEINGQEFRVPVGIASFYCNQTSAVVQLRNNLPQPIGINILLLSSNKAILNMSGTGTFIGPYGEKLFASTYPLCSSLYNQTFFLDVGYTSYTSLTYSYIGYRLNPDIATSSTIS